MISVGEYDRHAKNVLYVEGSVAEWSKALVLGTSLFGGVGSNPTAANPLRILLLAQSCKR